MEVAGATQLFCFMDLAICWALCSSPGPQVNSIEQSISVVMRSANCANRSSSQSLLSNPAPGLIPIIGLAVSSGWFLKKASIFFPGF